MSSSCGWVDQHHALRVRKGETLVELDPTSAAADRDRLTRELAAARIDSARLQAAATGRYDVEAFRSSEAILASYS